MDLRAEGPAGEVERYWLPDSFTWYTPRDRESFHGTPHVRLTRTTLRISSAALDLTGWSGGDRVQIGVNGRYLAIRRVEPGPPFPGLPLRDEKKNKKDSRAVHVACMNLVHWLEERGFCRLERLPVTYDRRHDMLVAERPARSGDATR